jgi:C-terminal processing protease CtpA/Prc
MKNFKKTIGNTGIFRYIGGLFAGVVMLSLFACPDPDNDAKPNGYTPINKWILENMQTYYLWNTHIPERTNKSLYPSDYFETLIYDRQKTDRFSWIQENFVELINSLSGINKEAGYDFNLYRWSQTSFKIVGCITYIKPNSPAERANLKRGDLFFTVNGTEMTTGNYSSLLSQTSEPHTISIADIAENELVLERTVSLSVVEYSENPVLLDTIYNIQDKKIGYLVYNFFANDSGDQSLSYIKALNTIFGHFKTENLTDLIIDFRYNSGGAITTANALAGMISNRSSSDIFMIEEYNSIVSTALADRYGHDYNKNYFLNNIENTNSSGVVTEQIPINKLRGLNKAYFIVSGRTASASELVINGIQPYMDVELIGETTAGKNLGSITIYEEDPVKQQTNKWGMQPIIVKTANAVGFSDYADGFTPDVEESELTSPMKPLGDTDEILLNVALSRVLNIPRSRLRKSDNVNIRRDIVGSSIDRTPARKSMYLPLEKEGKSFNDFFNHSK